MIESIFQGSLFTSDFLTQSIVDNADWKSVSDHDVDALAADIAAAFSSFPIGQTPNETRTEDDLIWPILRRLGWSHAMRQQNLTVKGRMMCRMACCLPMRQRRPKQIDFPKSGGVINLVSQ
ncbi:hypothetical protein ACDY97_32970 [Rhizobium mongolense]|uniref:hypothetical protein n=1 Tax=Rhizobium mongolense TaxID=57676 RepID=UPI003558E440